MLTSLVAVPGSGVDGVTLQVSDTFTLAFKVLVCVFMLGIALDAKPSDFRVLARRPYAVVVGVAAPFLLLPATTFLLTLVLDVRGSVALGMLLVACCPPGNLSNILTHRARGDVALSVSMSAVSGAASIVATPVLFAFWGGLHPRGTELLHDLDLGIGTVLVDILLLLALPFVLGLAIAALRPAAAALLRRIIAPATVVILVFVVVAGTIANWSTFAPYLGMVVVAVGLQDLMALGLGLGVGRVARVGLPATKAITFETGVRNTALALVLVLSAFDGLGGMALVVAFWGLWDVATGLLLSTW
jgi:BASS family bile acid:Na+ symporter